MRARVCVAEAAKRREAADSVSYVYTVHFDNTNRYYSIYKYTNYYKFSKFVCACFFVFFGGIFGTTGHVCMFND